MSRTNDQKDYESILFFNLNQHEIRKWNFSKYNI